jgi:hypothetical protein
MQIHQVEALDQLRHVVDPQRGVLATRETVFKQGTTTQVTHPTLGAFDIDPDGSFEVPEELGRFLCAGPGWYEGPNPFAAELEAAEKPARKPRKAPAEKTAATA